jgi:phosphoribosyl 1,2-cyclic phosphodiesterase
VEPESIDALCVTHEHDDHKSSLGVLHRRFGAQLYGNAGTIQALERSQKTSDLTWQTFITGHPFMIGSLCVEPFRVPHDSYDPVGFVISEGDSRVGVVTDLGIPTELIRQRLKDCNVLVLEANHDEDMLKNSNRPWPLKQRIAGRQGHLSNIKSGELLCDVVSPRLHTVLLAH